MIKITKEMLNKELIPIMKSSYVKAVLEYSMISAKWVDVKEERECYKCKSKIPKGTTSLTSSKRNKYGRPERIHRCYFCGNKAIEGLKDMNMELMFNEADNDVAYDMYFLE